MKIYRNKKQSSIKSARQADKPGSSGAEHSAPTKSHPSTPGTGSKNSPMFQASVAGARSGSTARRKARPSKKLLVEGVWVDVEGVLNPCRPSAESTITFFF